MSESSYGLSVITSVEEYQQLVQTRAGQRLVDLTERIPSLVLDIRYATPDNLLGEAVYSEARAFLREPVADALAQVQESLKARGLGLCVYDAYRPYSVTVRMYEQIQDEDFAAPPWRGSRHNRGCSVDVGLVKLSNGERVPLPTDFDEITPAARSRYGDLPAHVMLNRSILLATMHYYGFVNYPGEWWHFDHERWPEFDLLDLPFAAVKV
ncbi:M15 family metallopeptidase [Hymenobacter taeanensis]|uniref:D-alanyl-D-alanine dipeptidase n=1 Tax=Hymenobacter taeanensis TaxID=2735321 RepID=A0A6M6BBC0_9BACT|nr:MULTISPECIES: M15 family metallopeptidase [Hymenobacter]QJX45651.1 M15 family metallopeptidase [Hymenobacter taeanensis]UOQ79487.1 M15 family metallopeptidase [Hymenobacter sp. 5414T-23]